MITRKYGKTKIDEFEIHSDSITASRRCLVIVP